MFLGIVIAAGILAGFNSYPAGDLYNVDVHQLAEIWQAEHVSPADPYSLKHADLKRRLQALTTDFAEFAAVDEVGRSVEGREIYLVRMGTGPKKILLWSQMHGNEPTATCSLLDLFQFLGRRRGEPWVADILSKYTLLFIPMLNPDGADRNQRRNAQGIDINRDARALQTPEGRLLKEIRDRYEPFLGFNLHNQNGLTTVGDTGKVATIALLAVAADLQAGSSATQPDTLAKRVTAVLYEALSPFAYGHISRYDEDYNPRAFGDNLTLWGTPVVLIESGGTPAGQPPNFGVKLNFVGILAVLNSLATGRIENANPAVFDALKLNSDSPIYDLMLRNAWVFNGQEIPLFKGDIAIRGDLRAGSEGDAIIADLGDLGVYSAHENIDCTGMMVTPGLIAWDPELSLFSRDPDDAGYLRRGFLNVMSTARWEEILKNEPPSAGSRSAPRSVNWSFIIEGAPKRDSERAELQLAAWLGSGGRAWVLDDDTARDRLPETMKIPGWFGMRPVLNRDMAAIQLPVGWSGDPARVLPRWTSKAAGLLRLGRRGFIATGAPADLVLWDTGAQGSHIDMRNCTPSKVILGGRVIDLKSPLEEVKGRFLGRN